MVMIIVCIIFVALTIILFTGHGSFLVAGFNTLPKDQKAKFDKKKISKTAGWFLLLIDVPIITLTTLEYMGKMKDLYALLTVGYILLIVIIFMVLGKKKQ